MRYLNEFNAGVRARCEQAGLTPAETQAVGAAVDELYLTPGRKSAGLKTELQNLGYNIRKRFPGAAVDRAYDVALRLPAPVWFGGASALASVPFSLVGGLRRRGQQQEDGKTDEKPAPFNFVRNALLAGSAGAAVPMLLHRTTPFVRFSHDRELRRGYPKAVEVVKDNWKSLLEQKQKLPPAPRVPMPGRPTWTTCRAWTSLPTTTCCRWSSCGTPTAIRRNAGDSCSSPCRKTTWPRASRGCRLRFSTCI